MIIIPELIAFLAVKSPFMSSKQPSEFGGVGIMMDEKSDPPLVISVYVAS